MVKTVSIFSREGKRVLSNYLWALKQMGGSLRKSRRKHRKCRSCRRRRRRRRYRRRKKYGGAQPPPKKRRRTGGGGGKLKVLVICATDNSIRQNKAQIHYINPVFKVGQRCHDVLKERGLIRAGDLVDIEYTYVGSGSEAAWGAGPLSHAPKDRIFLSNIATWDDPDNVIFDIIINEACWEIHEGLPAAKLIQLFKNNLKPCGVYIMPKIPTVLHMCVIAKHLELVKKLQLRNVCEADDVHGPLSVYEFIGDGGDTAADTCNALECQCLDKKTLTLSQSRLLIHMLKMFREGRGRGWGYDKLTIGNTPKFEALRNMLLYHDGPKDFLKRIGIVYDVKNTGRRSS